MATRLFESEREAWMMVSGPQNAKLRRSLQEAFDGLFPEGHKSSLRSFAMTCSKQDEQAYIAQSEWLKGLRNIHPRAFALFAKYGQDYVPHLYRKMPAYGKDPVSRGCYDNAWWLMTYGKNTRRITNDKEPLVYVEGITYGSLVKPMLHAWNAPGISGSKAIDWTFSAGCRWSRYIGIPFTRDEHEQAARFVNPQKYEPTLFFESRNFERVESFLIDLLEKRSAIAQAA